MRLIYNFFVLVAIILSPIIIIIRIIKRKENPRRFLEKSKEYKNFYEKQIQK